MPGRSLVTVTALELSDGMPLPAALEAITTAL
jgi:hypothetical protein